MHLVRTNSEDADFISLVQLLDAELTVRDGDQHDFYDQYNKIDNIKYVIVAFDDNMPIACGAIKEYDAQTMEVKRMYTHTSFRGKGIASDILAALESWAHDLGYEKCILETGKKQPEAIALYTKSGYRVIANYGQYEGVENSVCFEKSVGYLSPTPAAGI